MVLVLLAAGAVSLLTGESTSAAIIAAMVLLSVALDQVQQSRAETSAQRLSETVALRARARAARRPGARGRRGVAGARRRGAPLGREGRPKTEQSATLQAQRHPREN
ncbi:MAG: hypothetical protein ABI409_07655 [Ramlibacter sp.]